MERENVIDANEKEPGVLKSKVKRPCYIGHEEEPVESMTYEWIC